MPQTREHMAIIELLGIPQGVVAITKTDLVDADMLELVEADIEDFLSETPYSDSPVVAVSSKTGDGLPLLLGLLEEAADRARESHQVSGTSRLPVDRVFTLKGIGTVVTGTLWSGRICAEDSLRLLPDGLTGRARTVQVHDRPVECADAGQRVAINISGIDKARLERGQMVVKGEGLFPTYMVDGLVQLLPSARPLKYGAQVRFHHGTADATAKLMFADRDRLDPGASCYAQIRLKTKIVPARGDRFILRSLTPVTTIGGGLILDPSPHKHGKGEDHQRRLQTLEQGDPAAIVSLLLEEARPGGLTRGELAGSGRITRGELEAALGKPGVAIVLDGPAGEMLFAAKAVNSFAETVLAALTERQRRSPDDPLLAPEELARGAGMKASGRSFQTLLAGLVQSGEVSVRQQRYSLASAEARLSESQKTLLEGILAQLAAAGAAPPSVSELAGSLKAGDRDMKLVLKLLADDGRAIKVKPDLYFSVEAVELARQAVIDRCREAERITLAEFRDILGVSRKFAQALLEYFDRAGLTRRDGDYRVLRKKGLS
jgi:selenocysteine-specific elongation factor